MKCCSSGRHEVSLIRATWSVADQGDMECRSSGRHEMSLIRVTWGVTCQGGMRCHFFGGMGCRLSGRHDVLLVRGMRCRFLGRHEMLPIQIWSGLIPLYLLFFSPLQQLFTFFYHFDKCTSMQSFSQWKPSVLPYQTQVFWNITWSLPCFNVLTCFCIVFTLLTFFTL